MPKISVLIPAYINNKKELKLLIYNLNQIKLQKMKDFEVVISDDSPSNIVEKYVKNIKDIDIKYIKNSGKKGIGGNTNNAMLHASGDLFHILYQDDYFFSENSLDTIVENFDYNAKWMVSAYFHTKNRNEFFNLHIPSWNNEIYIRNTIGTASCLTILNEDIILFDENLKWFVDCEYYYRLYKKWGLPKILEDIIFIQYLWEGQATNTITEDIVKYEIEYMRIMHGDQTYGSEII